MTADLHTLTGAYAVHALSAEEQTRFEQHLEQCDACREEVRELRETTALLAAGVAQPPPPGLRSAVLEEIATTRQLPPVVPVPFRRPPLTARRWFPPVTLSVAAALLALVVALSVVTFRLQHSLDDSRQANAAVAAVLSAPDARETTGASGAASGRVVVSRQEGKAVFFASGLKAVPADKDYQLWQIGPGVTRSAGLLHVQAGGGTDPVVVALASGADKLGVTEEPEGGSDHPTTDPLMLVQLPA